MENIPPEIISSILLFIPLNQLPRLQRLSKRFQHLVQIAFVSRIRYHPNPIQLQLQLLSANEQLDFKIINLSLKSPPTLSHPHIYHFEGTSIHNTSFSSMNESMNSNENSIEKDMKNTSLFPKDRNGVRDEGFVVKLSKPSHLERHQWTLTANFIWNIDSNIHKSIQFNL